MASARYSKWNNGYPIDIDKSIECLRGVYCLLLEREKTAHTKSRSKSLLKYEQEFYGGAHIPKLKTESSLNKYTKSELLSWYWDKEKQWVQEGKIKNGRLVLA